MKDLNQLILKFDCEQNFKDDDFYVSNSNKQAFYLLNKWPKWEKNFLNINGEKYSGKSHLVNIFIKKFKGVKFDANSLTNEDLEKIKIHENIVLENLDKNVDEKLLYSLLNIIESDNKFMITTSEIPIVSIDFSLVDLKSRTKSFLLQKN